MLQFILGHIQKHSVLKVPLVWKPAEQFKNNLKSFSETITLNVKGGKRDEVKLSV